jgi:predicted transposase/invertase (TIGR01784 family)
MKMDNQTFYPATNDVVFKAVFGSDKKVLMGFLNQVIGLSIAAPEDITVLNPEIPVDYADLKASRLDIRAMTAGEQVNLEMQVRDMDYYAERTVVYQSKMITDDMKKSENYGELKKTISVNILKHNMFETPDYYSSFLPIEESRHELLTDKWQIIFFELNKISTKDPNEKEQWLRLLKSGKEEVEMLRNSNNEFISGCADRILAVNADDKLRVQAELREMARLDENTLIYSAHKKGRAEGRAEGKEERNNELIAKWKAKGMTDEEIKDLLE